MATAATALRTRLGWLVLLAACWQPPAAPVPTGQAPPGAGPAPAPTVTWTERELATTGLPAIARDGSSIVIAHRDGDGGRGNPNLTLIEKDRGDRELRRLVVVSSDDVDRLDAAGRERRLSTAARWLEQRHAAVQLVAMPPLAIRAQTDDAPAQASGRGITVRWAPSQLVIALDADRGHPPRSRPTPASWLAADYPLCQTCTEVCHNDAFLGGAYADLERAAAVIVVSYRGTDTCWEPGSQDHVVVW
jgi:hypothetical protein